MRLIDKREPVKHPSGKPIRLSTEKYSKHADVQEGPMLPRLRKKELEQAIGFMAGFNNTHEDE